MTTASTPHALYRFFGAGDELLYIGITNNPSRRFAQHGVQRDWWHEVETIRMERLPDREAVLAAERSAIKRERPRYNVVHAKGPVTGELPEAGSPGDYPVRAGEVVALALAPNHHNEAGCPVGMVKEVSRFGVRLALMSWLSGHFGAGDVLVAWHQIMQIQWAERMHESTQAKEGWAADMEIWECAPLGRFQTLWTKGRAGLNASLEAEALDRLEARR